MITWLSNHIGTIIVTLALAVIVFAIIRKLIKNRKTGKSTCGCNCSHCAMAGKCHQNTEKMSNE